MTEELEVRRCPRDGKILVRVETGGITVFECYCGYREDDDTLDWLEDEALLARIEDAITAPGSAKPLVGEDDTAVMLLLTLIAGLSTEIRGLTASGKSVLADHVLDVFPKEAWRKITGLSDKGIRYLPNDIEILYVAERRGMQSGRKDEESTGEYDSKVAISEGGLEVATVEKDKETNKFETVIRKVNIKQFVFTTTEISAPEQLENRIQVLNVRDDMAQNLLVRDTELRAAGSFDWEKRDYSRIKDAGRRVVQHIRDEAPKQVMIPYHEALKPILSVERPAVRRNTPKLLDLIRACARVYYKQRKTIEGPDGQKGIVAEPFDLAAVLYIGERQLAPLLNALQEKPALALKVAVGLAESHLPITTEMIYLNADKEQRARLGAKDTIRKCVRELANMGYLAEVGKEGKLKAYDLVGSAKNPATLDVSAILREASELYEAWSRRIALSAASVNQSGQGLTGLDAQRVNLIGVPSMLEIPASVPFTDVVPQTDALAARDVITADEDRI
ncbi:MAG: hypothetical protein ABSB53_04640 [Nitrososphaerales archaeon]|jgi:hypothetical protein